MTAGKLRKIHVRNFQSHPDTVVNLSPGINAFIGASDQGKSAVLRSLLWAIDNRPSGDAIVSDWIIEKDGTISASGECSVTVESEAGELRRIKTKKRNGYDVNGSKLDAIRTGVPEEVSSFFGLESVNIQRQLEPPFLLSESGGARARFFNQLIRLEEIDRYLSTAESLRRATNSAIAPLVQKITGTENSIEALAGVPDVRTQLSGLELLEADLVEAEARKARITALAGKLRDERASLRRFAELPTLEDSLQLLETDAAEQRRISARYNWISTHVTHLRETRETLLRLPLVEGFDTVLAEQETDSQAFRRSSERLGTLRRIRVELGAARTAAALPDPSPAEAQLNSLTRIQETLAGLVAKRTGITTILADITTKKRVPPYIDKEIETLENQLPDTCPLCGATAKGTHDGKNCLA